MRVTLKLIGDLAEIVREKELVFPSQEMRFGEFVQFLSDRYGEVLREHLLPSGRHYKHYAILLNGANILRLGEMEAAVRDGDTIAVLTLVTGG